jgi:hypothetical protein
MVSPSSIKKKRTKRSRKESKTVVEELAITPPPSVEESKKKKSKKPKTGSSKEVYTMGNLYLILLVLILKHLRRQRIKSKVLLKLWGCSVILLLRRLQSKNVTP